MNTFQAHPPDPEKKASDKVNKNGHATVSPFFKEHSETLPSSAPSVDEAPRPFYQSVERPEDLQALMERVEEDPSSGQLNGSQNTQTLSVAELPSLNLTSLIWPLVFLGVIVILEMAQFLASKTATSSTLGWAYIGLIAAVTVSLWPVVRREYRQYRRLKDISHFRLESERALKSGDVYSLDPLLDKIARHYSSRPEFKYALETYHSQKEIQTRPEDLTALFEKQILESINRRAYRKVLKHSNQSLLLGMFSPIPFWDSIVFLRANLKQIQSIAELYGGRPGFSGTLFLVKRVLGHLAIAEVTDTVTESLPELLGGSVLAKFSTNFGQGLVKALLTAKIGLLTMDLCRPLPFPEENKPRLKQVWKELYKSLLFKKEESISNV